MSGRACAMETFAAPSQDKLFFALEHAASWVNATLEATGPGSWACRQPAQAQCCHGFGELRQCGGRALREWFRGD